MTDHVLCAIDLTHEDDARKTVSEAARQADMHDASLSVITVLPDYGSSWVGSFFKDGTLKEAADAADRALHRVVSEAVPDREQVQHIVAIGSVYEEVLTAIDTTKADLVVVGAHKPDFADRILGPNAARIVRHAPVSVLVLRL